MKDNLNICLFDKKGECYFISCLSNLEDITKEIERCKKKGGKIEILSTKDAIEAFCRPENKSDNTQGELFV